LQLCKRYEFSLFQLIAGLGFRRVSSHFQLIAGLGFRCLRSHFQLIAGLGFRCWRSHFQLIAGATLSISPLMASSIDTPSSVMPELYSPETPRYVGRPAAVGCMLLVRHGDASGGACGVAAIDSRRGRDQMPCSNGSLRILYIMLDATSSSL
jgi:hypothetical protein